MCAVALIVLSYRDDLKLLGDLIALNFVAIEHVGHDVYALVERRLVAFLRLRLTLIL